MLLLIYDRCGSDPLRFYVIPANEAEWVSKCNNKYINSDDTTPEMDQLVEYLECLDPIEQELIHMPSYTGIIVFGFVP